MVRDFLFKLTQATTLRRSSNESREAQYQRLRAQVHSDSPLETRLLNRLYETGRDLPDAIHYHVPDAFVEADFFYRLKDAKGASIFCDGKVHDEPWQREKDALDRERLEDYEVVVVRWDEDLDAKLRRYAHIWGLGYGEDTNNKGADQLGA